MATAMSVRPVLEILTPGLQATLQDAGRPGWRRFGIPPGGAMDRHALRLANQLLDNPPDAPVLECLQGARLVALVRVDIALAGAWGGKAWTAQPGETLDIPGQLGGVWHSLALPGGICGDRFLGSVSVCARAGIGVGLAKGNHLACQAAPTGRLPDGIKCRHPAARAAGYEPAPLRVWPGPQWAAFTQASQRALFDQPWRVSARSDRTGYRLEGRPLAVPPGPLTSEPVRVGSIQVPPDGQPVVTLHDGPTVGGYAKIGLIDADDLHRLVQTRPGQSVHFRSVA